MNTKNKVNVGVIGLGMMGLTHLKVYDQLENVNIVAIADLDPKKLNGETYAKGNIEGQAQTGVDFSNIKKYQDGFDLIKDKEIDFVDICIGTHLHHEMAMAVFKENKHFLIEKPLARNYMEALTIVEQAKQAKIFSMSAMCIRFWPGWTWVKNAIVNENYGKLLSLNLRRVASHPGGDFYSNGDQCGGALLDLHVHDTDFVNFCLGVPDAVFSRGYSKNTSEIDHVLTQYIYNDTTKPQQVFAEGSWAMAEGFDFQMTYTANFENATVIYSFDGHDQIMLYQQGKEPQKIEVESGMGYEHEIRHAINSILDKKTTDIESLKQAAQSLAIIEAEKKSIDRCQIEKVNLAPISSSCQ